jgi:hypothetical protein
VLKDSLKKLSSRIPLRQLERLQRYAILAQAFPELERARRFPTREALWEDLFAGLRDRPVCVLEFGVWQGYSLAFLARLNDRPESVLIGFDSFEGLPEDWHPTRPKGHFSTAGQLPQSDDRRVRFVKGLFQDALPRFRDENADLVRSIRSAERELVVHFDADLFSSTLYVLAFLDSLSDRYHFIFDDFIVDEIRALHCACAAFRLAPAFRGFVAESGTIYPIAATRP